MTITIRPLHLAILGAFLAGILVAAGVAFGLAGGSDEPEPEEATTANLDVAPTPSPTPEPTATPEPTLEPTAEPTPAPTSAPVIRSCAEIRADPAYRSPEERTFFLENCLNEEPASASGGSGGSSEPTQPSSPPSSDATQAEQKYRDRASASVNLFAVRIGQYYNTPSHGSTADVLEFGALMRTFANELDNLPPTPPRFEQVHHQLRGALIAWADYMVTYMDVDHEDEEEEFVWWIGWYEFGGLMLAALDDYALVVGIELPEELAP